jgi:hypothetical protein
LAVNALPFENPISDLQDTCCPVTSAAGGELNPIGQTVSSSTISFSTPTLDFHCGTGKEILSRYAQACGSLPLDPSTKFEAVAIDTSFALSFGGMTFASNPRNLDLPSICFVQSVCTDTWGFYQNNLLKVKFFAAEIQLHSVMISGSDKIQKKNNHGLWNGGSAVMQPFTMVGNVYVSASLALPLKIGGYRAEMVLYGNALYDVDVSKEAFDKVFAYLASGRNLTLTEMMLGSRPPSMLTLHFPLSLVLRSQLI